MSASEKAAGSATSFLRSGANDSGEWMLPSGSYTIGSVSLQDCVSASGRDVKKDAGGGERDEDGPDHLDDGRVRVGGPFPMRVHGCAGRVCTESNPLSAECNYLAVQNSSLGLNRSLRADLGEIYRRKAAVYLLPSPPLRSSCLCFCAGEPTRSRCVTDMATNPARNKRLAREFQECQKDVSTGKTQN